MVGERERESGMEPLNVMTTISLKISLCFVLCVFLLTLVKTDRRAKSLLCLKFRVQYDILTNWRVKSIQT